MKLKIGDKVLLTETWNRDEQIATITKIEVKKENSYGKSIKKYEIYECVSDSTGKKFEGLQERSFVKVLWFENNEVDKNE